MPGSETVQKILDLAENRYHGGDYAEAIRLWEKALTLDPGSRRAREGVKMAKMLVDAGSTLPADGSAAGATASPAGTEPVEGVGDLQRLLAENQAAEESIQQHIARGWELLKQGDRDGAVQECQEALVLDGSHPGVLELHEALAGEDPAVATDSPELLPTGFPDGEVPVEETPKATDTTAEALAAPEPSEPQGQEERDRLLVPEAVAGGTEYGKWENEFSHLDLDASVASVGLDPPVDAPIPGAATGAKTSPLPGARGGEGRGKTPPSPNPAAPSQDFPSDFDHPEKTVLRGTGADAGPETARPGTGEPPWEDSQEGFAPVLTVQPQAAPPRFRAGRSLAALVVLVVLGATAGWFFFLRGTGYSADRSGVETAAPAGAGGSPQDPVGSTGAAPAPQAAARAGSEEVQLPPPPPPAPEPVPGDAAGPLGEAEKRRKVEEMVRAGRTLYEQGRYQQALTLLSGALALDPVNFELKDLFDAVSLRAEREQQEQEAVDLARRAFEDGDFEEVLRKLYRTATGAEKEPTRTYIRNTWYNWGVQLLRAGNCPEAKAKLGEVLAIAPGDNEVLKMVSVADRYSHQAKDQVFLAFVERLRLREFDAP